MGVILPVSAQRVPCEFCPLRAMPHFRAFSPEELAFVSRFKRGELVVETGASGDESSSSGAVALSVRAKARAGSAEKGPTIRGPRTW